jgi:hypothetical protein
VPENPSHAVAGSFERAGTVRKDCLHRPGLVSTRQWEELYGCGNTYHASIRGRVNPTPRGANGDGSYAGFCSMKSWHSLSRPRASPFRRPRQDLVALIAQAEDID